MPPADDLVLALYVESERDRIVATLFEWLRIPSISAQPAHTADVRRSADFIAELMRASGLEHVEVLETDGAPAVYGAPVLFLGVGLPGDRIHAPNERMVMSQFWKGLLAAGELWRELGARSH
jgi:acetylornithine deacetylase/succinyl-diaminopimelate desuccinylase-like protein